MRAVACGRGRAEDNHVRVAAERVRSDGGCPPPLDNRAPEHQANQVRACPPRPQALPPRRDLDFSRRIWKVNEDTRISSQESCWPPSPAPTWGTIEPRSSPRSRSPRGHASHRHVPRGTSGKAWPPRGGPSSHARRRAPAAHVGTRSGRARSPAYRRSPRTRSATRAAWTTTSSRVRELPAACLAVTTSSARSCAAWPRPASRSSP